MDIKIFNFTIARIRINRICYGEQWTLLLIPSHEMKQNSVIEIKVHFTAPNPNFNWVHISGHFIILLAVINNDLHLLFLLHHVWTWGCQPCWGYLAGLCLSPKCHSITCQVGGAVDGHAITATCVNHGTAGTLSTVRKLTIQIN